MSHKALPHEVVALIHHVQLNDSGWWERTVDQIVKASMWMSGEVLTDIRIRQVVYECTGTELDHQTIRESTTRLVDAGELFSVDNHRFKLAEHARTAITTQIELVEKTERSAAEAFNAAAQANGFASNDSDFWERTKREAIFPVIHDLGARTYDLIEHKTLDFQDLKIVKNFVSSFDVAEREAVLQTLRDFLLSTKEDVRRFLLSQMSASFCANASRISKADLAALSTRSGQSIEFILFLDTNFIYSILELHDNPADDAASKLLDLMANIPDGVNIRPYVLPHTVDETRLNLRANLNHVKRIQATPNITHVAAQHVSGVIKKYFEKVGHRAPLTAADEYFQPYIENLIPVLREKGVELFNEDVAALSQRQDVIDDVLGRLSHEQRRYGQQAREYEPLLHDVVMWHFANDRRPQRVDAPTEARYWVVTIDYRFLGWDEFKRRNHPQSIQVCLLPSTLVQMLQFWVPRDETLDEALLDSVRLPFFYQEFDSDAERVTLKILSTISRFENAGDLSEETIERVVVSNALRSRMAISDDERSEIEFVREELVEQNQRLEHKVVDLNKLLDSTRTRIDEIHNEHEAAESRHNRELKASRKREERLRSELEDVKALQRSLEQDQARTKARIGSWLICVPVVPIVGGTIWATIGPFIDNWDSIEPIWAIVGLFILLGATFFGIDSKTFHLRQKVEDYLYRKRMGSRDSERNEQNRIE